MKKFQNKWVLGGIIGIICAFPHVLKVIGFVTGIIPLINSLGLKIPDLLGYYGSVFGGIVTIFGIYLTFENERKKTELELRRNSLPLLRFSYSSDSKISKDECLIGLPIVMLKDKGEQLKRLCGILKIENIGLQAAVISEINLNNDGARSLYEMAREGFRESKFKAALLAVPKDTQIELKLSLVIKDITERSRLEVFYFDIYKNLYMYELRFQFVYADTDKKKLVGLNIIPEKNSVIPKQL